MADQLYLNLWFPSFSEQEMLPRLLSVIKQLPFSEALPGVGYLAIHPLSFTEPEILEDSYEFRADPEQAIQQAAEFIHADYAYEIEAAWDIWTPKKEGDLDETWIASPQPVKFFAYGKDFDDGIYQEDGHVQVDFGLDTPFLSDDTEFTPQVAVRVKSNVQKLVNFVHAVEKNCGISGRVLWSESNENLAQKLIAKLQKVQ
ncbi:MAG: hypothetical protein JWO13_684 [Acidobacteriales bacterium]|nr:hypothetical protein [Terriglobales bacterium]